jgi:alkylation response protein AidB-like acyl-CoA dehydrogenase
VDFEFSPEQEQLRDSVRRLLADRAPITPYVRDGYATDGAGAATDAVWAALGELGVLGLLVPEAHGGAGMGMVDAAVVLEELGRAVNPLPYTSSAIGAVSLVHAAGTPREHAFLLPGLAGGSTVGTVAQYEPGRRYEWRAPATTASPDGDTWRIDGTKVHVADAASASLVLVTATAGTELGVFALEVPGDGVRVVPGSSVDGTRKEGTVECDGARGWRLGADASGAIASVLDRLAVAYVVDGVGAAARALELALDYAKERVQFDKPIGAFQAVQHLCADMLRVVELGRAAAYYACWAIDEAPPDEAHRAATMAQAYASEAFAQLGASAIQVFGGIGFTWEHDIHLFYKRLLSASVALGTADDHLEELATIALSRA